MPGFHPGIYAEYVDTGDVEPFVHFLRNGRPKGPWLYEVIIPNAGVLRAVDSLTVGQCALHIHLHYYDQAEVVLRIITQLQVRPDLKISVTSREGEDHVLAQIDKWVIKGADVRLVPNRGRNIGPFITEFGEDLRKYKVVGHLHGKRSDLLQDPVFVKRWVTFLMENMIDGDGFMADIVQSHFAQNQRLGLVFPDDPNILGWGENRLEAENMALRMGISLPLPQQINFPVGTMFWARPDALAPLFDLNLSWEDYPPEPVGYDGTMLHAIERLIPLIAMQAGYECAVTHVPGVSR